jgi:WD40 repeat protein
VKYFIFTGSSNGSISILDLNQPNKERFIKELSSFDTNKKIRCVRYNSLANELICGDEDGKISFWSLKTLEPLCNDALLT